MSKDTASKPAVPAPSTPQTPAPVKQAKPAVPSWWKVAQPFVFGATAACTATATIQPIDFVKVRLQLSGELGAGPAVKNPFSMAKLVLKQEGIGAFYTGLSAALVRQCTYGTARLGFFRTISNYLKEGDKPITPGRSAVAGLLSGAMGAMVGTPFDVSLVRMQSDFTLPVEQRRNYKNVFDAVFRIYKQEGIPALWKGNIPTIARGMALTVGQMSTYDQTKLLCEKHMGAGKPATFTALMIASFFAAAACLPFDFLKTRIQKQRAGPDGKLPYKNMLDASIKVVRTEGVTAFYKGFWTFYMRVGPHSIILLTMLEVLNSVAKKQGWQ